MQIKFEKIWAFLECFMLFYSKYVRETKSKCSFFLYLDRNQVGFHIRQQKL